MAHETVVCNWKLFIIWYFSVIYCGLRNHYQYHSHIFSLSPVKKYIFVLCDFITYLGTIAIKFFTEKHIWAFNKGACRQVSKQYNYQDSGRVCHYCDTSFAFSAQRPADGIFLNVGSHRTLMFPSSLSHHLSNQTPKCIRGLAWLTHKNNLISDSTKFYNLDKYSQKLNLYFSMRTTAFCLLKRNLLKWYVWPRRNESNF